MTTPLPTPSPIQTVFVQVPAPDHGFWHFDGLGDLATWVVGLLTAGSLLLGFSILFRDRRRASREQASQVVTWAEGRQYSVFDLTFFSMPIAPDEEDRTVTIWNTSKQPITRPAIYADFLTIRQLGRRIGKKAAWYFRNKKMGARRFLKFYPVDQSRRVIQPDEKIETTITLPVPIVACDLFICFMDSSGHCWKRSLRSAKLSPYRPHHNFLETDAPHRGRRTTMAILYVKDRLFARRQLRSRDRLLPGGLVLAEDELDPPAHPTAPNGED